MDTTLVETERLTRIYSTGKIPVTALSDINLSLLEGKFYGITGVSGSGKSTLMNLIGGLDTPSRGVIRVRGRCITTLNSRQRAYYRRCEIGMIFQSFHLLPAHTALENVALPLLFAGVAKPDRRRRAAAVLELVGLAQRSGHRPAELSGGEQQRVAIARALIHQPPLLLADEPTGNLDSYTSRQIIRMLADLNQNHGVTVIIISHEEHLLQEFAHEIIRLTDGKVSDRFLIR